MCSRSIAAVCVLASASLLACGEDGEEDSGQRDASAEIDATTPDAARDAQADTGSPRDASADAGPADASDAAPADSGKDATADAAPIVCESVAPTSCPTPAPRYATDIAPVIANRCLSCHDGTTGQWPLSIYRHLVDWSDDLRKMMLDCSMPPPDSGLTMELAERQLLLDWVRCGLPE